VTARVDVGLRGREYPILIGAELLRDASVLSGAVDARDVLIVTSETVGPLYLERVRMSLSGKRVQALALPDGEAHKTLATVARIFDAMVEARFNRDACIAALGGGVVGDMAGFAAACYQRGVDFVQLPTTLLAQVDSSVGGKTAINSAAGKNLVGAFHQPSLVLADLDTLTTLPRREMGAGYAEVIKYGILGDRGFFEWCEANGPNVLAGHGEAQEYAVTESVKAKARIVAEDERETTGARALLNLGHTFGHALEAQTGFSERLLHGEGVALGMVLAARYSARRGYISDDDAARVTAAIDAAGLPSEIAALGLNADGRALAAHMLHDKKMDAGTLPFVLLRGIGEAFLDKAVSLDDIGDFLDEELQAH